jgi:sigma-E factor negative regulatory protein RseC
VLEACGVVLSAEGDRVLVRADKPAACAACTDTGGCLLRRWTLVPEGFRTELVVSAHNAICVEPGHRVKLALRDGALWNSAWWAFGFPLVLMVCGALLGAGVFDGRDRHELFAAGAAGLGLISGLWLGRCLAALSHARHPLQPKVVSILA